MRRACATRAYGHAGTHGNRAPDAYRHAHAHDRRFRDTHTHRYRDVAGDRNIRPITHADRVRDAATD
jgi:hypothetical protein